VFEAVRIACVFSGESIKTTYLSNIHIIIPKYSLISLAHLSFAYLTPSQQPNGSSVKHTLHIGL